MLTELLTKRLIKIVGPDRLLTSSGDLGSLGIDRTTIWQANPCAVVLPHSVKEVQKIVLLANEFNLAIVPSGGRTGLSGGAVAKDGEIVLAMDHLNKIGEFNEIDRTVTVEAGLVTENLQTFARDNGLFYPVDFASSGSSQIGGNIATNAGGINVIRYGMTRQWILGLTVVNGLGEVLYLNKGLVKNNTGYDFRHLFIGSEGTLGIICEATIQLTRPPEDLTVFVLGIDTFPSILEVLKFFSAVINMTAFEFFSQLALDKVTELRGHQAPFETKTPFYVLIEFESANSQVLDIAINAFEQCLEHGWVQDGVISQSLSQADDLWKLRDDISETLWQFEPYKNDISVRVSRMSAFLNDVDELIQLQYPEFEIVWYGHIGDGNLHLNILKPSHLSSDQFVTRCDGVSDHLGKLIGDYQGSVSAEHGVGLLKRDYLHYSRSETEIRLMREIKSVFDPKGVLNPGKLIKSSSL